LTFTPGMALLVAHGNHHVAMPGVHPGTIPLQRSGSLNDPTKWLVALV
jgi:hypothetical protein